MVTTVLLAFTCAHNQLACVPEQWCFVSWHLIPHLILIFLIGILISFIKVVALADVTLGLSFWAYTLFTLGIVLITINFDRREIWHQLDFRTAPGEAAHG